MKTGVCSKHIIIYVIINVWFAVLQCGCSEPLAQPTLHAGTIVASQCIVMMQCEKSIMHVNKDYHALDVALLNVH